MGDKNEDSLEKIVADVKSFFSSEVKKKTLVDGPNYKKANKLLAFGCLQKDGLDNELEAIFHLTESHGASLRSQAIHLYQCNQNRSKNHDKNFSGSLLTELEIDHLSFDSFNNGYPGLFDRLKEMPKEWTIVQLTFRYNENEPWPGRLKDEPPEMLNLHVTRLPCGQLADERGPSTMFVKPHEVDKDLGSVLEIIQKSIKLITAPGNPKMKQKQREEAGTNMKSVTREIVSFWLKEWSCLMIGTLCDEKLNKLVKSTIDTIVEKFPELMISKLELSVLYQIADGCAHITKNDITNAVQLCILDKPDNDRICQLFIDSICKLKKEHSHRLMRAERNPVLLVLDDDVEAVPWEMIPVLFRHPVSRIPSVHFAQVLYNKHKDDIVNGNRIIKNTDTSFYIVNPDRDLSKTEEILIKFFKERLPDWRGIHGEKPTRELFVKCLTDYNVLMYSGHGNGAQFLSPEDICRMNINIVPLLFGCSSASKQHFGEGGKPEMFGLSDHFLLAGCPCLVGMLWAVTSKDIDLVTVMLLNITVSGEPININHIFGGQELPMINKEPELLRALKVARSVPILYTNGAALIARGIPVKFED